MAKLKDVVGLVSTTQFNVVGFTVESAERDGSKIAVLQLDKPIPVVEGSQFVGDDASGDRERLKAYDVETVRVHQDDFDADGIDIDPETRKGTVKCDLRLDVANSGDVWLKAKSFAAFAREKAGERKSERQSGIVAKMQERRAKATFKGDVLVDQKPEVVATATGTAKQEQKPVVGAVK